MPKKIQHTEDKIQPDFDEAGIEDDTEFMITDACMWEMNMKNKTEHPHAIEVVDMKTGQVRYIKSGSKIKFIEGAITMTRDQKSYNNLKRG